MGSILIALGLGFYLMGGTVAPMPVVAVVFTFFAALNLSFLTQLAHRRSHRPLDRHDLHGGTQHREP